MSLFCVKMFFYSSTRCVIPSMQPQCTFERNSKETQLVYTTDASRSPTLWTIVASSVVCEYNMSSFGSKMKTGFPSHSIQDFTLTSKTCIERLESPVFILTRIRTCYQFLPKYLKIRNLKCLQFTHHFASYAACHAAYPTARPMQIIFCHSLAQ